MMASLQVIHPESHRQFELPATLRLFQCTYRSCRIFLSCLNHKAHIRRNSCIVLPSTHTLSYEKHLPYLSSSLICCRSKKNQQYEKSRWKKPSAFRSKFSQHRLTSQPLPLLPLQPCRHADQKPSAKYTPNSARYPPPALQWHKTQPFSFLH